MDGNQQNHFYAQLFLRKRLEMAGIDPDAAQAFFDRESIDINVDTHEGLENVIHIGKGKIDFPGNAETGYFFPDGMKDFSTDLMRKQYAVDMFAHTLAGRSSGRNVAILVYRRGEPYPRQLSYDNTAKTFSLSAPVNETLKEPVPGKNDSDSRREYEKALENHRNRLAFLERAGQNARAYEQNAENARRDAFRTETVLPILDSVKKHLDGLYGAYEKAIPTDAVNRLDYVMIDGRSARSYINEYLESGEKQLDDNEKAALLPDMIVSAQLQGKRVTAALPDGNRPFESSRTEALPQFLGDLGETALSQMRKYCVPGEVPVSSGLTAEEALKEEKESLSLLEKHSALSMTDLYNTDVSFFKQDIMRGVRADARWNPDGSKTNRELLLEAENNDIKLRLSRNSFTTHVIALMMSEGVSPEIIFDPDRGADLREAAGKKVYELCRNKDAAELMRINVNGAIAIGSYIEKGVKNIDYSDVNARRSPEAIRLSVLGFTSFDILQERDKNKEYAKQALAEADDDVIDGSEEKNAKYDGKLRELTERATVSSLLHTARIADLKMTDTAIGIESPSRFRVPNANSYFYAGFVHSALAEAEKADKPFFKAVPFTSYANLYGAGDPISFQEDRTKCAELRDGILAMTDPGQIRSFAKTVVSGEFEKNHVFAFHADKGAASFTLKARVPGVSDPLDLPYEERDFHSGSFSAPTEARYADNGDKQRTTNLDSGIFRALSRHFGINYTKGEGTDRICRVDESGQLVSMKDYDFTAPEAKQRLRDLAVSGRLFAVRADETAPVQLQFRQNPEVSYQWNIKAAAGLDAPARPVSYGILQRLGAMLGIESCRNRKKQYENKKARETLRASLERIKEERKPLASFEARKAKRLEAEERDRQERLAGLNLHADSRENRLRAMADVYGSVPVSHDEQLADRSYTKEQFASLKDHRELELADTLETGTLPEVKDGKIRFRESDFIALSMFASANVNYAGKMRSGSEDSDALDPLVSRSTASTMFLEDVVLSHGQNGVMLPRQGIGRFIQNTISRGREDAARAIEEYRSGKKDTLASILADGLAFANVNYSIGKVDSELSGPVRHYMNAAGDMMAADPELAELVRAKSEAFRKESAEKLLENRRNKEFFERKNGAYMREVEETLRKQTAAIRDLSKKAKTAAMEEKAAKESGNPPPEHGEKYYRELLIAEHEKQQEYYYKDNARHYELLQESANFPCLEKVHTINSTFDPDRMVTQLKQDVQIRRVLDAGKNAKAELEKAALEGRKADDPEALMRAVYKAELIRTSIGSRRSADADRGAELAAKDPTVIRLKSEEILPMRRDYDPNLNTADKNKATKLMTGYISINHLTQYAEARTPYTSLALALSDPENGDAAFDAIYPSLCKKSGRLASLSQEDLVKESQKAETKVTGYFRKLAEEKEKAEVPEKAPAAEEKKELQAEKLP